VAVGCRAIVECRARQAVFGIPLYVDTHLFVQTGIEPLGLAKRVQVDDEIAWMDLAAVRRRLQFLSEEDDVPRVWAIIKWYHINFVNNEFLR
jgi:hypothetical protein